MIQRNQYPNIDKLANDFANYATEILSRTLERQETASLVIPGGNTPRLYLPTLANRLKAQPLPWKRISITLSDERWVDTDAEDSNEYWIKKLLLAQLPEEINFIGLKTTAHDTPSEAIPAIHQRLEKIHQPFTLTVLGLGEDGHIASLFPDMNTEETIEEITEQYCIAINPPAAPSPRVSLSLAALASSEQIALVITGKAKRQLLNQISKFPDPRIPLVWLLQRCSSVVNVFETD